MSTSIEVLGRELAGLRARLDPRRLRARDRVRRGGPDAHAASPPDCSPSPARRERDLQRRQSRSRVASGKREPPDPHHRGDRARDRGQGAAQEPCPHARSGGRRRLQRSRGDGRRRREKGWGRRARRGDRGPRPARFPSRPRRARSAPPSRAASRSSTRGSPRTARPRGLAARGIAEVEPLGERGLARGAPSGRAALEHDRPAGRARPGAGDDLAFDPQLERPRSARSRRHRVRHGGGHARCDGARQRAPLRAAARYRGDPPAGAACRDRCPRWMGPRWRCATAPGGRGPRSVETSTTSSRRAIAGSPSWATSAARGPRRLR